MIAPSTPTRALATAMTLLRADAERMLATIPSLNQDVDPALVERIELVADIAVRVAESGIGEDTADTLRTLRDDIEALTLPETDLDFGETFEQRELRTLRASLEKQVRDGLIAVAALGRTPSIEDTAAPVARSGNEADLQAVAAQLDDIVASLNRLEKTVAEPSGFPQQTDLIEFYVGKMRIQVDLARAQLTVNEQSVDLATLSRLVGTMASLTGDFVVTIKAWAKRLAAGVLDAATAMQTQVRLVATGIVAVTRKLLAARAKPAEPVEKPVWASAFGRDKYGVWAEISIRNGWRRPVVQRLRLIPAGRFMMGSPEDVEGRFSWEGPQHEVTIREPFWLFDTPCTQALWQAVMGNNPSRYQGPARPVERVSFDDIGGFLTKLNARVPGVNLTLPSEAQWEYACRASSKSPRYQEELDAIAWHDGNSDWESHDVKDRDPNQWGLHDMLGNVWEWCADGWHDSYDGAPSDGAVWLPSGSAYRVVRGGSWAGDAQRVRAASRDLYAASGRDDLIGFRLGAVRTAGG